MNEIWQSYPYRKDDPRVTGFQQYGKGSTTILAALVYDVYGKNHLKWKISPWADRMNYPQPGRLCDTPCSSYKSELSTIWHTLLTSCHGLTECDTSCSRHTPWSAVWPPETSWVHHFMAWLTMRHSLFTSYERLAIYIYDTDLLQNILEPSKLDDTKC